MATRSGELRNAVSIQGRATKVRAIPVEQGRILTLLPIANEQARGVYAASSFASQQVNRLVYSLRKLKRPEGRAPGAVSGCARRTRRIKNIFARMVLCL